MRFRQPKLTSSDDWREIIMEGLIYERKTPERGGETLAVREKVEEKSDVSVVEVEFLQMTVSAFFSEVPHDPP